jgi:hypothetical protein
LAFKNATTIDNAKLSDRRGKHKVERVWRVRIPASLGTQNTLKGAQEIMVSQGTEERVAEDWVFEEIINPELLVDPPNPMIEEFEEKVS